MVRNRLNTTVWLTIILVLSIGLSSTATTAQDDGCSTPQSIGYPIDTTQFQLAQDFGVASPRHQGRFHTAEDWFVAHNATLGQPVRAAASGVVTYSSPVAWGRDGGVLIIRHILEDGTIYYTQYGHLMETDTIKFPPRLTCVERGDPIGVIMGPRPAPHLHFEVRTNQPDIPGPGYTYDDPESLGWHRPAQVIINLQTHFNTAYQWNYVLHTFANNPPPLLLNDQSVLIIDDNQLRRILPDGRLMWRSTLLSPAVGIVGYQAISYVVFMNGTVQSVDVSDGAFGDYWIIHDFKPDSAPLLVGETLIFHTNDHALIAFAPNMQDIRWRLDDIPAFDTAHIGGQLIALVAGNDLWLVSHQGRLVGQAILRNGASFSTLPDGDLLAYTYGGLWRIDATGRWSEMLAGLPPGGDNSSAIMLDDGRLYLINGETLFAYTPEAVLSWQAKLPQVITGQTTITTYDQTLLVMDKQGSILVIQTNGGICGTTQLYGGDTATIWHNLGGDGILRLMVGDQLFGLDWQRFTNGC